MGPRHGFGLPYRDVCDAAALAFLRIVVTLLLPHASTTFMLAQAFGFMPMDDVRSVVTDGDQYRPYIVLDSTALRAGRVHNELC